MTDTNITTSLVPSIARSEKTIVKRLVAIVLSQWPVRTRGSPPVPNYLRRDVGLLPEERSRTYWDHQ